MKVRDDTFLPQEPKEQEEHQDTISHLFIYIFFSILKR